MIISRFGRRSNGYWLQCRRPWRTVRSVRRSKNVDCNQTRATNRPCITCDVLTSVDSRKVLPREISHGAIVDVHARPKFSIADAVNREWQAADRYIIRKNKNVDGGVQRRGCSVVDHHGVLVRSGDVNVDGSVVAVFFSVVVVACDVHALVTSKEI